MKCSRCDNEARAGQRYCKACHAAHMRAHRPAQREMTPEQRRKANARSYAKVYLRRGKIHQQPCSTCGSPDSEMHHPDYSLPLQIVWLCREHHLSHHQR